MNYGNVVLWLGASTELFYCHDTAQMVMTLVKRLVITFINYLGLLISQNSLSVADYGAVLRCYSTHFVFIYFKNKCDAVGKLVKEGDEMVLKPN